MVFGVGCGCVGACVVCVFFSGDVVTLMWCGGGVVLVLVNLFSYPLFCGGKFLCIPNTKVVDKTKKSRVFEAHRYINCF